MTPRLLSADEWVGEMITRAGRLGNGERELVGLAGPPGSGKSTLSERVEAAVNAAHPGRAAILAQDGYHFDDEVLVPRGWRDRKGAPHTFDVGGLVAMIARLRQETGEHIAVPRFDRTLEIARAGARIIAPEVRLIIVEGNYLALDAAPWTRLAGCFDETAMIRVSEEALERRLLARWRDAGFEEARIHRQVHGNDMPNVRLVYDKSRACDVEVV